MDIGVADIAAWLIAIAFGWAGVAKIVGFRRWSAALSGYGFGGRWGRVVAVSLPAVELVVAALFIAGHRRPIAATTVALLGGFSLAILNARGSHGDRLPCGCFGGVTRRDYRVLLARNGALGAVAAVVLLAPEGRTAGVALPAARDVPAALLALAGLMLVAWTLSRVTASIRGSR